MNKQEELLYSALQNVDIQLDNLFLDEQLSDDGYNSLRIIRDYIHKKIDEYKNITMCFVLLLLCGCSVYESKQINYINMVNVSTTLPEEELEIKFLEPIVYKCPHCGNIIIK